MAVMVNRRARPADDAAKALAIARSGRSIAYTGDWRRLMARARMLDEQGIEIVLHRFPNGVNWLVVGPVDALAPLTGRI